MTADPLPDRPATPGSADDRTAQDRTAHDQAPEAVMSTDQTERHDLGAVTTGPSVPASEGSPAGSAATTEVPVAVVEPTGPALGTLVWGCTALAVAALLGLWELADVRVDVGLVVPVVMLGLGLLLVVGAVVTALRQRR